MRQDITIVRKDEEYNRFGELVNPFEWKVIFQCKCAYVAPVVKSGGKSDIVTLFDAFEGTKQYIQVVVETCACKCYDICSTDIWAGDYLYTQNKYWKILGVTPVNDCGCWYIRIYAERLEPRETHKKLIECVSCFDVEACDL